MRFELSHLVPLFTLLTSVRSSPLTSSTPSTLLTKRSNPSPGIYYSKPDDSGTISTPAQYSEAMSVCAQSFYNRLSSSGFGTCNCPAPAGNSDMNFYIWSDNKNEYQSATDCYNACSGGILAGYGTGETSLKCDVWVGPNKRANSHCYMGFALASNDNSKSTVDCVNGLQQ